MVDEQLLPHLQMFLEKAWYPFVARVLLASGRYTALFLASGWPTALLLASGWSTAHSTNNS